MTGGAVPPGTAGSPIPTSRPAARAVALLLGVSLLALAVVGIWELLVRVDVVGGGSPIAGTVRRFAEVGWQDWYPVIGVLCVVLGVVFVVRAFLPLRHDHLRVRADSSVWIRPADLGRLATARANRVRGVLRSRALCNRRRLVVRAFAGGTDRDEIIANIEASIRPVLDVLVDPPTLHVFVSSSEEIR